MHTSDQKKCNVKCPKVEASWSFKITILDRRAYTIAKFTQLRIFFGSDIIFLNNWNALTVIL